jgi:hypothetical protein
LPPLQDWHAIFAAGGVKTINMESNKSIEQILHALEKLENIAGSFQVGTGTNRELFQFGYNAGRLAELTGAGRVVWDKLKSCVEVGQWHRVQHMVWEWRAEARAGLPIESKPQPSAET